MTMGLACDSDGYDLKIIPCKKCGSRGCAKKNECDGKERSVTEDKTIFSHEICIALCEELTKHVRSNPRGYGWEKKAYNVYLKLSAGARLLKMMREDNRADSVDR